MEVSEMIDESDSTDNSNDEDYRLGESLSLRKKIRPHKDSKKLGNTQKWPFANSRLFEIVIMRKHARLSSCLQRVHLALSSDEKYIAIADILSFICECAGFRHSSINSSTVEEYDSDEKVFGDGLEGFGWFYFTKSFSELSLAVSFEKVMKDYKYSDTDSVCREDELIYPEVTDFFKNKKSRSISDRFYLLCMERVKRVSSALNLDDGWGIGTGKRNVALLRFKEFFQLLVAEADSRYFNDLFLLLQWIFALSLCGFRAVRQIASMISDEVMASILIKLECLSRDETTYRKQLGIELEMDQRTHERMNGKFSEIPVKLTNSTIELWRRLVLSRMLKRKITTFVKVVYFVSFTSKLRDVSIDIRVYSAFSLVGNLLLNPQIFSASYYWRFVLCLLPESDEDTKLLLVRYISLLDFALTDDILNVLLDVYGSCMDEGLSTCCSVIESILIKDLNFNGEASCLMDPRNKKNLLVVVKHKSNRKSRYLSVLVALIFLRVIPIRNFSLSLELSLEGLKQKYKGIFVLNKVALSRSTKLKIDDVLSIPNNFVELFEEIKDFLAQMSTTCNTKIAENVRIMVNILKGLWDYSDAFQDVGCMIRFLYEGSDVSNDKYNLSEMDQTIILQISLVSLSLLAADLKKFTQKLTDAVETISAYTPMLLRLYRANTPNMRVAIRLIEISASLLPKLPIERNKNLIPSTCNIMGLIMDSDGIKSDARSIILLIRSLYNLYDGRKESRDCLLSLYSSFIGYLNGNTNGFCGAHVEALINTIHYFPLELGDYDEILTILDKLSETASPKLLECALGFVVYEAQIYGCVNNSQKSLDPRFIWLKEFLINSLAEISKGTRADFEKFVCFSSICSILQITNLVEGTNEVDEVVEIELFRTIYHFISKCSNSGGNYNLKRSNRRNIAHAAIRNSNDFSKDLINGIKVTDVYVRGVTDIDLCTLQEICESLINQFSKTMCVPLYSSNISVLIILNLTSDSAKIANASAIYLRFLLSFDSELLHAVFLFTLIGLYESCNRTLISDIISPFITHTKQKGYKSDDLEKMVISGLLYSLQGQSNWEFIKFLASLVSEFKKSGGTLNSILLNSQIKNILDDITNSKLRETILNLTGHFNTKTILNAETLENIENVKKNMETLENIGSVKKNMETLENIENVKKNVEKIENIADNRYSNLVRRKPRLLDFTQLPNQFLKKSLNALPSSTCIKKKRLQKIDNKWKKQAQRSPLQAKALSHTSSDNSLEISPIVTRNLTKLQFPFFPPSIGTIGGRTQRPIKINLDELDPEDLGQIKEYEPVALLDLQGTTKSSCLRSTTTISSFDDLSLCTNTPSYSTID